MPKGIPIKEYTEMVVETVCAEGLDYPIWNRGNRTYQEMGVNIP